MSKTLYYAEQSIENALKMQPVPTMEWDSLTGVLPSNSTAKRASAIGAGQVPPSGYYSSHDGQRLMQPEAAPNADAKTLPYIAIAGIVIFLLFRRR